MTQAIVTNKLNFWKKKMESLRSFYFEVFRRHDNSHTKFSYAVLPTPYTVMFTVLCVKAYRTTDAAMYTVIN